MSGTSRPRCSTACRTRRSSSGFRARARRAPPAELAAHARLVSLPVARVDRRGSGGRARSDGSPISATLSPSTPGWRPNACTRLDFSCGTERTLQLSQRRRRARPWPDCARDARAARIHRAALGYYRARRSPMPRACRASPGTRRAPGERREAAATYLLLAERARERHDYLEADLLYSRALDRARRLRADARQRALKGRGIVRYRLGAPRRLSRRPRPRARLAVESGDAIAEADVMLDESMALDWLFEWRRSRELAEAGARAHEERRAARPRGARHAGARALVPPLQPGQGGRRALARRGADGRGDRRRGLRGPRHGRHAARVPPAVSRIARRGRRAPRPDERALPGEGRRAAPGGHLEQPLVSLDCAQRSREIHGDNERVLEFARRMGNAHLERGAQPQQRLLPLLARRIRGRRAFRPPHDGDRRAASSGREASGPTRRSSWPASYGAPAISREQANSPTT